MKRHNYIVIVAMLSVVLGAAVAGASTPRGMAPTRDGVPVPRAAAASRVVSPRATGGPDQFGYTWDDSVSIAWIDATDGTQLSLTGCQDWYQSVSIPFPFRYYGVSDSGVWVHFDGYLVLGDTDGSLVCSPTRIPSTTPQNSVAAPYWSRFADGTGTVYSKSGGTAPDRWLVIEWLGMTAANDPSSTFTFEAVLHEGGDITFQYQSMTYGSSPGRAVTGIEEYTGYDGLCYQDGGQILSGTAIQFPCPPVGAHLLFYPKVTGGFVAAGQPQQLVPFNVPQPTVVNYGELGDDTFDLTASSGWNLTFDGPTDTNGNGIVDTGPLVQLGYRSLYTDFDAPWTVGASNTATITATSSNDPSVSRQALVQSAVPARFALAHGLGSDQNLMVMRPSGTASVTVANSPPNYTWPIVLEQADGNLLYAWFAYVWNPNAWVAEVMYSIRDRNGGVVLAPTALDDHSDATMMIWGWEVSAAVTPDGRVGIVWHDDTYDADYNESDNVYFAVLDEAGNILVGPENLTNNIAFGQIGDLGVPFVSGTHIAATGDNRFVLTWVTQTEQTAGTERNVYLTIFASSGSQVKGITNLSGIPAGTGTADRVGMGGLSGNRVAVAYSATTGGQIEAHILDSDGTEVAARPLGGDGFSIDAVELAGKRTLIGWLTDSGAEFAILDPSFNLAVPPTPLPYPGGTADSFSLSVTTDARGNGILTWEAVRASSFLTYAYVDPSGNVLTPPTVFRVLNGDFSRGSGLTTYRPFADVPVRMWAAGPIEKLLDSRITTGCTADHQEYCPTSPVTRAQMAAFLLRTIEGADYVPPSCGGIFQDVACPGFWAADYIEDLFGRGITTGCNADHSKYCPTDPVTRAQMAVFLLRSLEGPGYTPPPCSGIFQDVACPGFWAADYIEDLFNRGLTTGCTADHTKYCPTDPVTRAQMATFLTRTFAIP